MNLVICFYIFAIVFAICPAVVECQLPFWQTTTPQLILPRQSNTKYYEKFNLIPSKIVTADKLVNNFFRHPTGARAKRQTFLEDTVVVLDSSESIGSCEFKKGKRASKHLMEFPLPSNYKAQYAGVQYSWNATIKFNFLPANQAASKSDTFSYEAGSTNTADGLAKAKQLFDNPSAGSRRGARQMVFLVTGGRSSRNKADTVPNAQKLKDAGVEIFVIAIGNYIGSGISEMVRIASYPPEQHLLRAKTFSRMTDMVLLAIKKISPGTYQVLNKIPRPC